MDEIEDVDGDIDEGKLLFIASNKEKFDFNTFMKPLNFISAIYNWRSFIKRGRIFSKILRKKKKN